MPLASRHQRLVGDVYRAALQPELWPETIGMLCDALGTASGLIVLNTRPPDPGFLIGGRTRADLADLYLQRYAMNALTLAMRAQPFNAPILSNAIVDWTSVRRSAFHADILRPQAIAGMFAIKQPSFTSAKTIGGVSFNLNMRQLDDYSSIARRFKPMLPHLIRALDISMGLGRAAAANGQLISAVDLMPMAALLLDRQGCVVHLNTLAESLLREADGIALQRTEGMRLVALDPRENRSLGRSIGESAAVAAGREVDWVGVARISRPSGRPPLRVLATPLSGSVDVFAAAVPSLARVLVQIVGVSGLNAEQAGLFRSAYGLTGAETRVASLIGSGLSAPATARVLGLSVATVKSHIGRCFDKTEVRSQAELARLMAQVPARLAR